MPLKIKLSMINYLIISNRYSYKLLSMNKSYSKRKPSWKSSISLNLLVVTNYLKRFASFLHRIQYLMFPTLLNIYLSTLQIPLRKTYLIVYKSSVVLFSRTKSITFTLNDSNIQNVINVARFYHKGQSIRGMCQQINLSCFPVVTATMVYAM